MTTTNKRLKQRQKDFVAVLCLMVICIIVTAVKNVGAEDNTNEEEEKTEQTAMEKKDSVANANGEKGSKEKATQQKPVAKKTEKTHPVKVSRGKVDIAQVPNRKEKIKDSILLHSIYVDSLLGAPRRPIVIPDRPRTRGSRFRTSGDYAKGFPDLNDVQLATASKLGIPSISDRKEAMERKDELVYIGENPYYVIDKLSYSIPYLIPRAAVMLEEISRSFIDSLASRGMDFYRPLVTSVLRTENDVKRLMRVNCNATQKSCHQYGTTFDISYSKFIPVYDPGKGGSDVWPAELKQILAEVLDDQRRAGMYYVKYESHQSCFHITVR